jgi:dipeptidyl aminopeptidase/acylaminoacyl peptidase
VLLGAAGAGAELAGVQGSGTAATAAAAKLPSWMPEVDLGAGQGSWRRLWAYEIATRKMTRASRDGLNVWEAAPCGAGRAVAVTSEDYDENAWYSALVTLVDLESGRERPLYKSDVQVGLVCASQDGMRVAFIEALCSDRMVMAGDLIVVDLDDGGSKRIDAAGIDITKAAWRDDSRVAFIGLRGLDTVAGEVDVTTGATTELWSTTESCGVVYPDLRPLGARAFATVVQSYDRYPEVALVDEGQVETLTSLGHRGADDTRASGGALERVEWDAPDGMRIEALLVRPSDHGPHPLVVDVHGGPVGVWDNRWTMRSLLTPLLVSRGFAMLFPNPRGSSGRGRDFAAKVRGDMGGADATDILMGVDHLVTRGVADPDRVAVMGGSYGGFMTCMLVCMSDRFGAAVAYSPVTDWYSQHWTSNISHFDKLFLEAEPTSSDGPYFARSPVMLAGSARTPTLLTAGARDRCTPAGQAVEFHLALLEQGIDTHLAIYPEEGHGVRNLPTAIDFSTRVVVWFERHLGPGGDTAGGAPTS